MSHASTHSYAGQAHLPPLPPPSLLLPSQRVRLSKYFPGKQKCGGTGSACEAPTPRLGFQRRSRKPSALLLAASATREAGMHPTLVWIVSALESLTCGAFLAPGSVPVLLFAWHHNHSPSCNFVLKASRSTARLQPRCWPRRNPLAALASPTKGRRTASQVRGHALHAARRLQDHCCQPQRDSADTRAHTRYTGGVAPSSAASVDSIIFKSGKQGNAATHSCMYCHGVSRLSTRLSTTVCSSAVRRPARHSASMPPQGPDPSPPPPPSSSSCAACAPLSGPQMRAAGRPPAAAPTSDLTSDSSTRCSVVTSCISELYRPCTLHRSEH
mmetsp:Transcript_29931/g.88596  ORF Transcript_29931/g.88596 Transcript_29931/m.88596 type:complete len:327 (-) Transcript_29931:1727-2707(-)